MKLGTVALLAGVGYIGYKYRDEVSQWAMKALPKPDKVLEITVPLTLYSIPTDQAEEIRQALTVQHVEGKLNPPRLLFYFGPVVLHFRYGTFRWQPPPYTYKLKPTTSALKVRGVVFYLNRDIGRYQSSYIEQIPAGTRIVFTWKIPFVEDP